MANKPVDMSKLKQVLRLYKNGDMSNRKKRSISPFWVVGYRPFFAALGHQACMLGFKVRYFHVFKLFEEITNNRIEGTLSKFFKKLADTDLLIIDDFGIRSLDKQQMLDFMELMEDRHGMKSTIIVSQLPVANWYDMMKVNSTAADAILDRIVHTAQRFELKGDSLRKK